MPARLRSVVSWGFTGACSGWLARCNTKPQELAVRCADPFHSGAHICKFRPLLDERRSFREGQLRKMVFSRDFLVLGLAPARSYGTIAPAFTESCPSGRRSTIGNRVGAKSVSRVQIPDSPPELPAARIHLDCVPFFTPCGGVAEWLNAAVSKTVYGYSPYEGSNPSSSAISILEASPDGSLFCCPCMDSNP